MFLPYLLFTGVDYPRVITTQPGRPYPCQEGAPAHAARWTTVRARLLRRWWIADLRVDRLRRFHRPDFGAQLVDQGRALLRREIYHALLYGLELARRVA